MDISQKKATQNHKMRSQCVHPSVKISNATSKSAIWKFIWLAYIEREVQLRMFASYRSLELALLFSIYTNKQFKALKSLDIYC